MYLVKKRTWKIGACTAVLSACLLGTASQSFAQLSNPLLGQVPDTICAQAEGAPSSALTDGDLATLWSTSSQVAPCHFIYRFEEPIAVSAVTLHNRLGKGAGVPSRRATIWASHQSFDRAFYRLAHDELNDEGATQFTFDEPVLMRTLKVTIENDNRFSGERLTASLAEIEVESVDPSTASRWPAPRPEPFQIADPLTQGAASACDELAAYPFNPDSYGFGRGDHDIDVTAALDACRAAVADAPNSMRLAAQLARVEGLAEDAVQSVARLASPLLADYPPAMLELAFALRAGRGVAENQERATTLIDAAAQAGYLPALHEVAKAEDEAFRDALVEGETAGEPVVSPALQRLLDAQYPLAYGLYNRHILRTDTSALLAFMPRLEEQAEYRSGGSFSQHLYNNEHGIPRDRLRALRWVQENADRWQDASSLGSVVVAAWEVLNDGPRAIRAGRLGAYSGDPWPVERLAVHRDGAARQRLYVFAYNAALRDAQAGNSSAMFGVATALINGRGVEEDSAEGARWMRLAAAAGEPRSITYLQNNSWAREQ